LNALGARLRDGMNACFEARGLAMRAGGDGTLCRILLMNDPVRDYRQFVTDSGPAKRLAAIHARLLDEGVIITRAGTACLSTPMGESEVEMFVRALDRALDHVPA
jgi:glutamate-1-semialdehyde 2,1-aminomutase